MSETKFRAAVKRVESIVKINSKCRKDSELKSCFNCPIYNVCKANDYDHHLGRMNSLAHEVPNSFQIQMEIRKQYA